MSSVWLYVIVTFVCIGVIFFIFMRQKSHIKIKAKCHNFLGQSVTNDTSTPGWKPLLYSISLITFLFAAIGR